MCFTRLKLFVVLPIVSLALATGARAQVVATYRFDHTLAADQAGAPALTAVNGGSFETDTVFGRSHSVYKRSSASNAPSSQAGLQLDTSSLGLSHADYAVELVFKFSDSLSPDGYRRIVNGSKNYPALDDPGLYVGPGNALSIYSGGNHPGATPMSDGIYYDVVLSVTQFGERAYLNGQLEVSLTPTPDLIYNNLLSFFMDDSTEYGNGSIAQMRIFNRSLTGTEVAGLYNQGAPLEAVPEPFTLGLLGLGAVGYIRRRRSR